MFYPGDHDRRGRVDRRRIVLYCFRKIAPIAYALTRLKGTCMCVLHYETLQCAGVKFFALNIAAGRYYKLLPCRKDTEVTAAKLVLNPGVLGNKASAFFTRDKTQEGVW